VVVPIEEEKNTNIRNARNASERSGVIPSSTRRLSSSSQTRSFYSHASAKK
jgi:hypothetical protein